MTQTNERGKIKINHTCIHSDTYDFACGKCIDIARFNEIKKIRDEKDKQWEKKIEEAIKNTETNEDVYGQGDILGYRERLKQSLLHKEE